MSNSTVTITVTSFTATDDPTESLAVLAAAPLDFTLPNIWGLLLTDDVTSASGVVLTRVMTFKMVPTIGDASGTSVLFRGDPSGSPVKSITTTSAGGLYARPPVVTLPTPANGRKAQAYAVMQVGGVTVINGGAAYSGAAALAFVGGDLQPGGTVAAGTLTIVANVITAVTITAPGGPYDSPPLAVVTDSGGGAGAILSAGLNVKSTTLVDGGLGYTSAPAVTYTPLFKEECPDTLPGGASNTAGQARTMQEYMKTGFQRAIQTPVNVVVVIS
jgi:hypothetical protein